MERRHDYDVSTWDTIVYDWTGKLDPEAYARDHWSADIRVLSLARVSASDDAVLVKAIP